MDNKNMIKKSYILIFFTLFWFSFTYADEDEHHKKHGLSDVLFKEMNLNNDSLITASEFNQTYKKHRQ